LHKLNFSQQLDGENTKHQLESNITELKTKIETEIHEKVKKIEELHKINELLNTTQKELEIVRVEKNKYQQAELDTKQQYSQYKLDTERQIKTIQETVKELKCKITDYEDKIGILVAKNTELTTIKTQFDENERLQEDIHDMFRKQIKQLELDKKEYRNYVYRILVSQDLKEFDALLPLVEKHCTFSSEEIRLIKIAHKKRTTHGWLF